MSAAHSNKRGRDAPHYGIMHVEKFRQVLVRIKSGRDLTSWLLLTVRSHFPRPASAGGIQHLTEQDFADQHWDWRKRGRLPLTDKDVCRSQMRNFCRRKQ